MDDCISRQAAIDVADRADYPGLAVELVKAVTDEVIKELKQLPSAQPTLYGFNLKNLIVFADAVNKKGISDFEIEDFVRNARDAWEYAWEEFQRTQKKALESIMRSDYYEG